jgi:hypothetical protein
MKVDTWYTWCSDCQSTAKVIATQPYRDLTWRIEIHCVNYDCKERGILTVIEVKV